MVGLAATLMVGAPIAATAGDWPGVGATDEPFNQTLYYSEPRWHGGGSGAYYRLDSHTGMCGSQFWLALRAGDSTNRNYFSSTGLTKSFVWHNGSLNIPANFYRITARNDCAGNPGGTYTWSGHLHLS